MSTDNIVKIYLSGMQVLGHLPADVAKWLGPLVSGGLADAAGTVLEDPTAPGAPTTISVQASITLLCSAPTQLLLSLAALCPFACHAQVSKTSQLVGTTWCHMGDILCRGTSGPLVCQTGPQTGPLGCQTGSGPHRADSTSWSSARTLR